MKREVQKKSVARRHQIRVCARGRRRVAKYLYYQLITVIIGHEWAISWATTEPPTPDKFSLGVDQIPCSLI